MQRSRQKPNEYGLFFKVDGFAATLDTETTIDICQGMKRGPHPVEAYHAIMAMLRAGQCGTLAEAAELAGVSRERVRQWCAAAGLDWRAVRAARVERWWAAALTKRKRRRRSKAEIRAATEPKIEAYLKRGGKIRRV